MLFNSRKTVQTPPANDQTLLSVAVEIAADSTWDLRLDSREIRLEPRFWERTGCPSPDAPKGLDQWISRVHPDDAADTLEKLTGGGKDRRDLVDVQFRFLCQSDAWIWLHARGKVVSRTPSGDPLRIFGIITDITDKKAMEARKYEAEAVWRLSEERYKMVVENAHDAIIIVQNGQIRYANPSTERLLGYSRDEITRDPFDHLLHEDDRQKVVDLHQRRMQGKSVPDYYSFKARHKSGKELWLEINTVNTQWQKAPAVQAFIRDVTQTRQLEQQLYTAQKMQAIGTLAGGIAHDFNNILSAMMGYAEICLTEAGQDNPLAPRLKRILQAGGRAKDLVSQVLSFSRQGEGEKKPVELGPIIDEAVKLLGATVPSNVTVDLDLTTELGIVQADPSRIHQIVMNLCVNAVHAVEQKGGRINICLENIDISIEDAKRFVDLEPGPYAKIIVSDTGHGIPPEVVTRIFDPYFTTKPQHEGTGLGLSVVHGIVTGLGGAIRVYSEPGQGTDFSVYLPQIRNDLGSWPGETAQLPRGGETILLVDNEKFVLDMTTEMLQAMGYKVVPRISSIEALHAFEASSLHFDLVVTDQSMPHMNGEELTRRIHAICPDMPVIMCTGFSNALSSEKKKRIGLRAVLNKPVLQADLAQTLRKILDTSGPKAAAHADADGMQKMENLEIVAET